MILKINPIVLILITCISLISCNGSISNNLIIINESALFSGLINKNTVNVFIAQHQNKKIKKIIVDSGGGEPIAAMRFGEWIHDNNIDIEVNGICMSSCANYLFTAAKYKTISSQSIVGWHGGAEQKNFRDLDLEYDVIYANLKNKIALTEKQKLRLLDNKMIQNYEYSQKSRPKQNTFYAKVKVSEYITRAGQEPTNFKSIWTLSRNDLKKFGVCNVNLPLGYGNLEYLQKVKDHSKFSGLFLLEVTNQIASTLIEEIKRTGHDINTCN